METFGIFKNIFFVRNFQKYFFVFNLADLVFKGCPPVAPGCTSRKPCSLSLLMCKRKRDFENPQNSVENILGLPSFCFNQSGLPSGCPFYRISKSCSIKLLLWKQNVILEFTKIFFSFQSHPLSIQGLLFP